MSSNSSIPAISSWMSPMNNFDYGSWGTIGAYDLNSSYPMGGSIFDMYNQNWGTLPFAPAYCPNGMDDWQKKYQEYMRNMYKFNTDMAVENAKRTAEANAQVKTINGPIDQALKDLARAVENNEQSLIMPAYHQCEIAVKDQFPDFTKEQIKSHIIDRYQETFKKTLIDSIIQNSSNPFEQGLKKGLTFGVFGNSLAEDNISQLTNLPVSKEDKATNQVAIATGATIATCAAWSALKALSWLYKNQKLGKFIKIAGIIGGGTALGYNISTQS